MKLVFAKSKIGLRARREVGEKQINKLGWVRKERLKRDELINPKRTNLGIQEGRSKTVRTQTIGLGIDDKVLWSTVDLNWRGERKSWGGSKNWLVKIKLGADHPNYELGEKSSGS